MGNRLSDALSTALDSISGGIIVLAKNIHILIPVYGSLFISYIILSIAVFNIIPPEKIVELSQRYQDYTFQNPQSLQSSERFQEELMRELMTYFTQDLARTLSILALFALLVFVIYEFTVAGFTASSIEINRNKRFSLSAFAHSGFIFTFKMIQLEILMFLIGLSISSPFLIIYYISKNPHIFELVTSVILFILTIFMTFSRCILVTQDPGVFETVARGIRFGFKNIVSIAVIFGAWFLMSIPITGMIYLFPPVILLLPSLMALLTVMFARLYVLKMGGSI